MWQGVEHESSTGIDLLLTHAFPGSLCLWYSSRRACVPKAFIFDVSVSEVGTVRMLPSLEPGSENSRALHRLLYLQSYTLGFPL